ncbi:MAG: ATP-binding protein [Planctomycetota bacterium]|nr:ATP-binding protein [Planctomycetota bacterium]
MSAQLEQAILGLADVLGVALVVVDSNGEEVIRVRPQIAGAPEDRWPLGRQVPGVPAEHGRLDVTGEGERRRFAVAFEGPKGELWSVESEYVPAFFAWIDGRLLPQKLPGCPFEMEENAGFLLGIFVAGVCRTVVQKRSGPNAKRMDDLDVENIRRIGSSLRGKIDSPRGEKESVAQSLEGIPSLDQFFLREGSTGSDSTNLQDLTEIVKHVATGAAGSINLMSLTGDFVIETPAFSGICKEARRKFGSRCFASDIRDLIGAALSSQIRDGIPVPLVSQCHAHLTEIVAPVLVDGLIVGLVFAGQLANSGEQLTRAVLYTAANLDEQTYKSHPLVTDIILENTKKIVSGLASLIAQLFDRYCAARNEAALIEAVVDLPMQTGAVVFRKACETAKKLLSVSECSAFRLDGDRLILAATTARQLMVRDVPRGEPRLVTAEHAIDRAFYRVGEGLTGRAVNAAGPLFYPNAMEAEVDGRKIWAGKCSEMGRASQCLLARIWHASSQKCYGVLRGARFGSFSEITPTHRVLFAGFANQLAMLFHTYDLTHAQSELHRKQAGELQDLLAEVAHEFKGPLHNILQLSVSLRYTFTDFEHKSVHQRIKEEVYRAKRNTDNYLLRGIEGKEEVRYNFQSSNIGLLVAECIKHFLVTAARKGVTFQVSSLLRALPPIVADKERLDQVFSNIIDNAVKYSFDHSIIEITAKSSQDFVTFSIKDFGLGIPKNAEHEIFEGYQRTVEDKTRFKPGSGLGLKIAKRIVVGHGGTIAIESIARYGDPRRLAMNEGYDTTFRVSLPKAGPAVRSIS